MFKPGLLKFLLPLGLTILCAGCATSYSVSLRYRPQAAVAAPEQLPAGSMFSACRFVDMRAYVPDKRQLGIRVLANGNEVPVSSISLPPADAIASAIKTYLFSQGCSVYGWLPDWDLNSGTIDSHWGRFAIGGRINEFRARAWEDMGLTCYRTTIVLRVVVADVRSRRIIYSAVVDAGSTLQHLYFSETFMQREINNAFSSAVERFFSNPALYNALKQAQTGPREG